MRNFKEFRKYRAVHPVLGPGDDEGGFCIIPLGTHEYCANVIFSIGDGWDHVSVSLKDRCPTWEEMHRIKKIFFRDDEVVIQIFPKEENYLSHHPYCLHLWKCQGGKQPTPPKDMVAPNVCYVQEPKTLKEKILFFIKRIMRRKV